MSENLNLRKAEATIAGIIEERSFRKTVAHHDEIRREMLAGLVQERHFDAIDEAMADPIHDHKPYSAPGHKVNRVLGILDQLEKENSNRRFMR